MRRCDKPATVAPGDPFELDGDGDEIVAVLVHGFTGTPYEMSHLGAHLARQGIAVRAPLLPGHGTSIGDLDRTGWRDWAGAVERAVEAASARFRRVAVIGQSLGGLLALHVASRRPELAAVGSLAAPLWLPGWSGRIAAWTTTGPLRWISKLPKLGGSDVRDPRVRAINPSYRAIPTRALGELLAFMQVVDAELPQIACPVLVMHATHDHTAPVACAARIADRARAERVRILPRSYHLIAIDLERDLVADEVTALLRRHRDTGDISCDT
ncbi:MAG: alpha/beta hydrolase [Kofleriaceae bacterium]